MKKGGDILRLMLATNHYQVDSIIEKLESEKGIKELEALLNEEGLSRWAQPLLIVDQAMYRERVIEKAKSAKPDVILLYDKLPGTVDLELILDELRLEVRNGQDRDIRIVFLTSLEQGSTLLRKAVEIGIWDIVSGNDIRPIEIIKRIYNPANYSDAAHYKLAPDDGTKYKLIPKYVEKEKVRQVPVIQEREVIRIVEKKEYVTVGKTKAFKETVLVWSPFETGKTLLAVNLATVMANMGFKTALIDTDLEKRSLENYFNLKNDERYAFLKALKEKRKCLDMLKSCHVYKNKLKLFTLPSGIAEMPEVSVEEFLYLLDAVRGEYDIFIIDGAKDINSYLTRAALTTATRVLLIVTPDLIRTKYIKIKLRELSSEGIRLNKFEPVVNFALPGNYPGREEIKEILELEPIGEVPPAFKEAYLSICQGVPAVDVIHHDTGFFKAINNLAKHICGESDLKAHTKAYSLLLKLIRKE